MKEYAGDIVCALVLIIAFLIAYIRRLTVRNKKIKDEVEKEKKEIEFYISLWQDAQKNKNIHFNEAQKNIKEYRRVEKLNDKLKNKYFIAKTVLCEMWGDYIDSGFLLDEPCDYSSMKVFETEDESVLNEFDSDITALIIQNVME